MAVEYLGILYGLDDVSFQRIQMHSILEWYNMIYTMWLYQSNYTIVPLTPKSKSFPNSHALTD